MITSRLRLGLIYNRNGFCSETNQLVSRIRADGGVSNPRLIDRRIHFLKSAGLWDNLALEVSPNYGYLLESGKLKKLYNIKEGSSIDRDAVNTDSATMPSLYTEANGIIAVKFGNPESPSITYLNMPLDLLKNKQSGRSLHVVKLTDRPSGTSTQYVDYISTSDSNKTLLNILKRDGSYAVSDDRNKYFTSARRINESTYYNVPSLISYTSESYKLLHLS